MLPVTVLSACVQANKQTGARPAAERPGPPLKRQAITSQQQGQGLQRVSQPSAQASEPKAIFIGCAMAGTVSGSSRGPQPSGTAAAAAPDAVLDLILGTRDAAAAAGPSGLLPTASGAAGAKAGASGTAPASGATPATTTTVLPAHSTILKMPTTSSLAAKPAATAKLQPKTEAAAVGPSQRGLEGQAGSKHPLLAEFERVVYGMGTGAQDVPELAAKGCQAAKVGRG